jgi:hypothetical protein
MSSILCMCKIERRIKFAWGTLELHAVAIMFCYNSEKLKFDLKNEGLDQIYFYHPQSLTH